MPKEPPEFPHGVRLRIAYDGTDFHGWQFQGHGLRTVQGTVEEAIAAMGLESSRLRGASRTDAGVHAQDEVLAFACKQEVPEEGWVVGLNGVLPDDVSVKEAKHCHRLYNPRFDAQKKLYRYMVATGQTRDPMTRRYAWQYGPRIARRDQGVGRERGTAANGFLDIEAMQSAADRLVAQHDFQAFRAYDDGREHTRRHLERVEIIAGFGGHPQHIAIEVEGDGFMKNMIRIIAGTLTDVGRHRLKPEIIDRLLGPEGTRGQGGPTAPAHGLTLQKIWLKLGDHKRAAS